MRVVAIKRAAVGRASTRRCGAELISPSAAIVPSALPVAGSNTAIAVEMGTRIVSWNRLGPPTGRDVSSAYHARFPFERSTARTTFSREAK